MIDYISTQKLLTKLKINIYIFKLVSLYLEVIVKELVERKMSKKMQAVEPSERSKISQLQKESSDKKYFYQQKNKFLNLTKRFLKIKKKKVTKLNGFIQVINWIEMRIYSANLLTSF